MQFPAFTPAQLSRTQVLAVLTSHNRVALTLRCLERLAESALAAQVDLSAVLVDDGSTDGTSQAVAARFPWVMVERGDGSLFWNRGMHRAMARALREPFDHLLWVNDDTELAPDALRRLLALSAELGERQGRPVIVVGATADRLHGRLTYGGVVAANRWRPVSFTKVHSADTPLPCHTMNGNTVLLPAAVVHSVGNLDPAFEHSMGDIDYGLRARKLGHPIFVAPGFIGVCSNNPAAGSYLDTSLALRKRWQLYTGRKVLPPASWRHLARRHAGLLWPLYFALPYAGFALRAAWASRRRPALQPPRQQE